MLENLLLMNAIGTAIDVGGKVIDGVTEIINGETLEGSFSQLLTKDLIDQGSEALSAELTELLNNANKAAGANISALPEKITELEAETFAAIEKLLSNKPIIDNQITSPVLGQGQEEFVDAEALNELAENIAQINNAFNASNNQDVNGTVVAKNAADSLEGVKVTSSDVDGLEIVGNGAANKNLGVVQDGRPLGKDNLNNLVNDVNKNASEDNLEILSKGKEGSTFSDDFLADKNAKPIGELNPNQAAGNPISSKEQNFDFNIASKPIQDIESLKAENNNAPKTYETKFVADGTGYKVVNIVKTDSGIELKLNPESLGKVQIKLDVTAEGKTSLIVIADKAETLDMLQRDARGLEKILQDSGLKADSNSLSFNLNDGSGEWKKFQDMQSGQRNVVFNLEQLLNEEQAKDVGLSSYLNNSYGEYSADSMGALNITV